MKKQGVIIGLVVFSLLNLTGCATAPKKMPVEKILNHCQMPEWMKQQLSTTPVINIGQTIIVVLPSDQLFLPRTANMLPESHSVVEAVACVFKYYNKVSVNIQGYTNYYSSWKYNQALSRLQASKVAEILWQEGVDTRLMTASGMGAADPIMSPLLPGNRRIVVKFKYLDEGT